MTNKPVDLDRRRAAWPLRRQLGGRRRGLFCCQFFVSMALPRFVTTMEQSDPDRRIDTFGLAV
jgi:hypothetical protein